MPFNPRPVTDETDALATFLGQQQDAFRSVIHGLATPALAATYSASSLSLGELVRHVTRAQENWLIGVLAAPEAIPEEEFNAAATRTQEFGADSDLAAVLEEYDDVCARVLDAVRSISLDVVVPVPDLPWFPKDIDGWQVRWVWLHLIQELARHAGHADIIRETIDGATMYELVAAREGLEPGFLQPWQPSPAPYSRGISTVVLAADDVAAAGRWYADLLGVPLTYDTPAYVEVEVGPHAHQLGILDRQYAGKDWGPAPEQPGGAVVHLWVPSLDMAITRATDAGATTYQPIRDLSGGYRGASVVDPFGNVLGLMERPAG